MALLLAAARKIAFYDRMVRAGKWAVPPGKPLFRLSGSTLGESDEPYDMTFGPYESVFVCGSTHAITFPLTPGAFQAQFPHMNTSQTIYSGFVTRLDPSAHTLMYSTLFTGRGGGWTGRLNVDPSGVLTSGGAAFDFPWSPGSYDSGPLHGVDLTVSRLRPQGDRLLYATHVGGPYTDGSGDGLLALEGRAVEAAMLARYVRWLLESGRTVRDPDTNEERPLQSVNTFTVFNITNACVAGRQHSELCTQQIQTGGLKGC